MYPDILSHRVEHLEETPPTTRPSDPLPPAEEEGRYRENDSNLETSSLPHQTAITTVDE